eukprot:294718-Pelagomonas_calceolata.AAC.3
MATFPDAQVDFQRFQLGHPAAWHIAFPYVSVMLMVLRQTALSKALLQVPKVFTLCKGAINAHAAIHVEYNVCVCDLRVHACPQTIQTE